MLAYFWAWRYLGVNPLILDQYNEEVTSLAILRAHAVEALNLDLSQLVILENHIKAHIDGLSAADLKGLNLLLEQLGTSALSAAVLAFQMGRSAALFTISNSVYTYFDDERYFIVWISYAD
ncbi:hypothetical protein [Flavobacterium collinsii]|uniref:hypothetical protein n=1 Tax=Flavobacterium collinsii TaxID=1114861 RepID=UPI00156F45A6|nr:hypothetical protein [Flavobacterium collinsii]